MYICKKLECELCHKLLPDVFHYKNSKINLVDIPKPAANCLVLENITQEKLQQNKIMYVVKVPSKGEIKLGRGHECEVRINDISVSRYHATIKFSNGKFYLQDNNSKFGTLVLLKSNPRLEFHKEVTVQIGRTVVSFEVRHKKIQPFVEEALPLDKKLESNDTESNIVENSGENQTIEFSILKKEATA